MNNVNKYQQVIADSNLNLIETGNAIYVANFNSWNDVESFCKKINKRYNCDVAEPVILYHRDGRSWEFKCTTDKAFNVDADDACEAHNGFIAYAKNTYKDFNDFAQAQINPYIEGLDEEDNAEEIEREIAKGNELWNEIQSLQDNEVLIIDECGDRLVDTLNTLRYYHDVHNYMIAVAIDFPKEEVDFTFKSWKNFYKNQYVEVEVVKFKDTTERRHSDYVEWVDEDSIPEDKEFDPFYVELMDEERYNRTMFATGDLYFNDCYNEGDKILVFFVAHDDATVDFD